MASIFFFFALPAAIDFHLNFFFILGDRSQNREARRRLAPFSLPVAHNFLFFFGIDVIWWQGSGLIGRQGVKGLCHHTLIFVAIFRLPFFSISSSSQQLVFLFGNLLWRQRRWLANFGQNRCCFRLHNWIYFRGQQKARQTFKKLNFTALRNCSLDFRFWIYLDFVLSIADRCGCQSKSQIPSCQRCAICLSTAIETKSECDMVSSSSSANGWKMQ